MKKSKILKGLTVLVIIAICLISFCGIYVRKQGRMTNVMPEYRLGMNLSGARVAKFKISDKTEEIIYDAEGNVTTDGTNEDGTLKEGYTKESKPVNSEELLNEKNYEIAKRIMQNRIDNMGINEYDLRLNYNNGEIIVALPEDSYTDMAIANLSYLGKFEIKDSKTDEVLMDNSNIKNAAAVYGNTNTGTRVYLSIEFNKEGKQKLEDITRKYISSKDEEGNDTTNKISIKLDDETLLETYFDEPITTGSLELSIGSASNSNEEISDYVKQANQIAGLIKNDVMKIKYELSENNYVSASIDNIDIKVVLCVIIAIQMIGFIYWSIRYKANGIFALVGTCGFMAIIMLDVRYANVTISLESIVAIISILVSNFLMLQYALRKLSKAEENKAEIIKETYKRYTSILLPLLIVAIVFTFINWLPIASIGMLLFWGMVILMLYNYITMSLLFDLKETRK